jgi:hypothetical protein
MKKGTILCLALLIFVVCASSRHSSAQDGNCEYEKWRQQQQQWRVQEHYQNIDNYRVQQRMYNLTPNVEGNHSMNRYYEQQIQNEELRLHQTMQQGIR